MDSPPHPIPPLHPIPSPHHPIQDPLPFWQGDGNYYMRLYANTVLHCIWQAVACCILLGRKLKCILIHKVHTPSPPSHSVHTLSPHRHITQSPHLPFVPITTPLLPSSPSPTTPPLLPITTPLLPSSHRQPLLPSSHHHTTHSPHRNDVIREDGEVPGSHVERLVSHQLKVGGSCETKSEEGFK